MHRWSRSLYKDEPGSLDAETLRQLQASDPGTYAALRAKAETAVLRKRTPPTQPAPESMTRVLDVLDQVGVVLVKVEALLGGVRRAK